MNWRNHYPLPIIGFAVLLAASSPTVSAQATATASRDVEPTVYVGLSGVETGVIGGRNLGITAGVNVGFRPYRGFLPSLDIRGTYPIDGGQIASERSAEGGLRVEKRYNRFRPYADFLAGRGQINYQNGGFIVPAQDFRYIQSTSNVFSPGIGVQIDITDRFAALVDAQFQHWDLPFDPSGATAGTGSIFATVGTIGVVYRFGWLQHGHPAP